MHNIEQLFYIRIVWHLNNYVPTIIFFNIQHSLKLNFFIISNKLYLAMSVSNKKKKLIIYFYIILLKLIIIK